MDDKVIAELRKRGIVLVGPSGNGSTVRKADVLKAIAELNEGVVIRDPVEELMEKARECIISPAPTISPYSKEYFDKFFDTVPARGKSKYHN